MQREKYRNGNTVGLAENGCDGCELAVINGQLCHEIGCPESWRDTEIECRDCGCDFIRLERNEIVCPDCAAADDPDFLPDGVEIFHRSAIENQIDGWVDSDGNTLGEGWYWWSCFPGCLPDSDQFGPFDTEREAFDDFKGF